MTESARPRSVVVGIDGSKAAIHAALWAVEEAVSRDVPLRLHCAVEQGDTAGTAEAAVRQARVAIEAAGKPVKIDADVVPGPAVGSLIRASASAAMVCVGAVGLRHFQPGRLGSTAAALAMSARCPVAIIRGREDRRRPPAEGIVVGVDGSPDNGVLLGAAVDEALLRNAGIQVVLRRRTVPADTGPADNEGERRALADLDRRLGPLQAAPPAVAGGSGGGARRPGGVPVRPPPLGGVGDRGRARPSAGGRTGRTGRQRRLAGRRLLAADRESAASVRSGGDEDVGY